MNQAFIKIIAEAGVNHNGSIDMAISLVDAAKEAGADIVKFQTFRADRLANKKAPKADYQLAQTDQSESQYEMLRRLELSEEAHDRLVSHCRSKGISFLSTPFDEISLDLLAGRFDLPLIKLGSGELTNAPLLLAAGRTGKPVILSTGMGTLGEIEQALGVLAFGYGRVEGPPSRSAFAAAYADPICRAALQRCVTLLHCTTEYPAPFSEVNLKAMDTMQSAFGLPVGYSDHTEGIAVSLAAAARGATVIEKHFTLDKSLPGPDHKASLEPRELSTLVASIRQIEAALGDGVKSPAPSEVKNVAVARKSLVAKTDIQRGDIYSMENLTVKRPGNGVSPFEYWDILGTNACDDCAEDNLIKRGA